MGKKDKTFKSFQQLGKELRMSDDKMYYDVYLTDVDSKITNKIFFLKNAIKYNVLDGSKINHMGDTEFFNTFSFASNSDKENNKLKNLKNTEFALAWFKEKNENYSPIEGYKKKIEKITGLLSEDNLQSYVNNLIPYSFIIHAKIELTAPYFSKDDDEFYLVQNPCLKEKVFKVPMVRGSGWKGVIAKAFRELINEADNSEKIKIIQSYLRIFGTGSNEFRMLEETIKGFVEKGKNLSKDDLIKYLLFELGFKLTKDDIDNLNKDNKRVEFIREKFWSEIEKNSNKELPHYLTTHKGRAIFYPTYFDRLSLEIINPHSRKTRAGTNPIHYEVVPKGTTGFLQMVYIPFDGVLRKNEELRADVEQDIKFLTQAIEKAQDIGIGAKEKLGWGKFTLSNKKYCVNGEIGNIENWEKCEGENG